MAGGTRALAGAIGVTRQSILIWASECRKDRNFLLPAERVPQICRVTGQPPYLFRPDLWEKEHQFDARAA